MNNLKAPVLAAAIAVGAVVNLIGSPALADVPENWRANDMSFETCSKTGGQMPEFFVSVDVDVSDEAVVFNFLTRDHGPVSLPYHPDGLVRRGTDYHYLADGTVLPDLPAHEAAYWEENRLIREEITYLPDNTYVLETNTLEMNADGQLSYQLHIDGELWLSATCT